MSRVIIYEWFTIKREVHHFDIDTYLTNIILKKGNLRHRRLPDYLYVVKHCKR